MSSTANIGDPRPLADARAHRGSILVTDAPIVSVDHLDGAQHVVRVDCPGIAERALPGSFVHLRCDSQLSMRRPMSIMRASAEHGWVDILYKSHGEGTRLLASKASGDLLNLIGPIGRPFTLAGYRPRPLLIGGGVGIPPMIFLAEHMRRQAERLHPLVLMGSEVPFPFRSRPSTMMVQGLPDGVIGAMPLLEDWSIPSRLASQQGFAGCFDGFVTDLARAWLERQAERDNVEIFACGPTPMLRAVAALARDYALPCQISLEEYMACAVGSCAGCTVLVSTPTGPAMKRVCVDGPVFDAADIAF